MAKRETLEEKIKRIVDEQGSTRINVRDVHMENCGPRAEMTVETRIAIVALAEAATANAEAIQAIADNIKVPAMTGNMMYFDGK